MSEYISKKSIQIMRFWGIIMVLIHHAVNNLPDISADKYILSIVGADVTVFFLISGFLFEMKSEKYYNNKKEFIYNKFLQLIIPYLFWSILLYGGTKLAYLIPVDKIGNAMIEIGFAELDIGSIIWNILISSGLYVEYLWFIYILFIFFIVSVFAGKKLNNILSIIIVIALGIFLNYYFELYHIIWKFFKHFSDFLIGRFIFKWTYNNKNYFIKNKNKIALFSAFLAVGLFIIYNIMPDKRSIIVEEGYAFIHNLFNWCIVIVVFFISEKLSHFSIGNILKSIGDYSYDIYLIHIYFVFAIGKTLGSLNLPWLLSLFLTVAISAAISVCISKFILRKFRLLSLVSIGFRNKREEEKI